MHTKELSKSKILFGWAGYIQIETVWVDLGDIREMEILRNYYWDDMYRLGMCGCSEEI